MVKLIPVAMIVPNRDGVYAPSRLEHPKHISYEEFIREYADHPKNIKISFAPDGESNPVDITAYGKGFDCWYIVE